MLPANPSTQRPLSVWELTSQIKDLLEAAFPTVWVAGEVSNFARPQSGHCYLTLKDDRAQLRAVMWRGVAIRIRFDLHDGLEVICRGHLDLYAARGSYQLVIEDVVPKGMGALELALRQLREKLAREGLFDRERKRPLPAFVRRIAVVTSPTGAAIRDFLQVLGRRWRGADVLVVPVRVQGEGAAAEIAAAIETVNRLPPEKGDILHLCAEKQNVPFFRPDCLVVTRGGGSMEDLWAFNEEAVVRAIAASRIPVISAVGHEIDVTLSDLAADVRALTPSEAAELVAPGGRRVGRRLAADRAALGGRFAFAGGGCPLAVGRLGPACRFPSALATGFRSWAAVGRTWRPFASSGSGAGAVGPAAGRHRGGAAGIAQSPGGASTRIQSNATDGRWAVDPRRRRNFSRRANDDSIRKWPDHKPGRAGGTVAGVPSVVARATASHLFSGWGQ